MEPDEGRPPELPIIKEYSAEEERSDMRRYRIVTVGDVSVQIDMQAVEPYKKVIQHMGKSCDTWNMSTEPGLSGIEKHGVCVSVVLQLLIALYNSSYTLGSGWAIL